MFPQLGLAEIVMVLVIALLVVGPKRLPGLARDAGKALRDFKSSVEGSVSGLDLSTPVDAAPPAGAVAGQPVPLSDDDDDLLEGIIVSGGDGPPRRPSDGPPPAT